MYKKTSVTAQDKSDLFWEAFTVLFQTNLENINTVKVKVKVKQSRYRPGVAQRVPGS
jgi:hypothetical protein